MMACGVHYGVIAGKKGNPNNSKKHGVFSYKKDQATTPPKIESTNLMSRQPAKVTLENHQISLPLLGRLPTIIHDRGVTRNSLIQVASREVHSAFSLTELSLTSRLLDETTCMTQTNMKLDPSIFCRVDLRWELFSTAGTTALLR